MKLILGVGNPGREYALTRHNVGWWALDHLADAWKLDAWSRDGESLVTSGIVDGVRTRLMKPQTYVNLSGTVLRPYVRRATWSAATDLLVIVDDVALPVGTFRLRGSGSSGGHNGLKSIEAAVGSRDYARLRIGIRPPEPAREINALADFVLHPASREERTAIASLWPELTAAVETWLTKGVEPAMNQFNRRSSSC